MKTLSAILIGIIAAVLGTILWESSLLRAWHTGNPLDALIGWLGSTIPVLRIVLVGLVTWFFASLVHIWREGRRVKIYSASYASNRVHKDVTEILRKKVEEEGCRKIPVSNEFLGGDPDVGRGKILTVVYSVRGRRKTKTAGETEHLKLS